MKNLKPFLSHYFNKQIVNIENGFNGNVESINDLKIKMKSRIFVINEVELQKIAEDYLKNLNIKIEVGEEDYLNQKRFYCLQANSCDFIKNDLERLEACYGKTKAESIINAALFMFNKNNITQKMIETIEEIDIKPIIFKNESIISFFKRNESTETVLYLDKFAEDCLTWLYKNNIEITDNSIPELSSITCEYDSLEKIFFGNSLKHCIFNATTFYLKII